MAIVELNENQVLPQRTNYDMQIERDPTFKELAKATFENEHLIVNIANKFAQQEYEPDPSYDVYADARLQSPQYAGYADRFIGVESRLAADQVFSTIDRELENKAVMASGGLEGVAASLLVGFTDPTMLIPIGGAAYKTYRTGGAILQGAARTGLMTGTIVGAQELALHSLQETRTAEESAWNVGGATFLGGIIGGAGNAFGGRAELNALAKRVEDELHVRTDPYDGGSVSPEKITGRFHGTSSKISSLSEYTYSSGNIYGQGFYTTDNFDIATGYTKKGKGGAPTVYLVKEKPGVSTYNIERPLSDNKDVAEAIHAAADMDANLADVLSYISEYNESPTLRNVYDELRDLDESADVIQETFDTIQNVLESKGFHGIEHIGGQLTNNDAHSVKVFFNPMRDIEIEEFKTAIKNDPYDGGSVGAMATPTTTLDDEALKSALGLEKLMAFQDPLLRMANSPSKTARKYIEQLAESTLTRSKNTKGIASPISVENRIKGYELPKYLYLKERDRLFLQYRNSKSKVATNLKDLATDAGDRVFRRSRQDGKLTYQEFKEAIAQAGRRGDTHEIPEVAAAAKAKREMVIDPIFKAAKEVGLIDPGTTAPQTAQSYVNRLWDHNAIKANRREFEDINTKWLIEKRNRAASELENMFKEFDLDTNYRVGNAIAAERAAFREAAKAARQAGRKADKVEGKIDNLRLSIDELNTRLKDATKNQERIYSKILNKRERGDTDMSDLFFEFRSVSSAKRELYKRLLAKEGDAELSAKELLRRKAIADDLAEQERLLEEKLARLEDQTKLMEDLEYRASFDDGEFPSIAYKLTDRILGTPAGRLSYDNKINTGKNAGKAGKRGPAKARVYDIPDEMVEKFLVNDDDILLESYVKSLASDIELTKTFGSIDPEDALKAIQDDYELLERGISDPKVLNKLREAKNADLRDFSAVWERLRGTYGQGSADDYASGWRTTERALMNVNYLAMLGGMTVSAFVDVAQPVLKHGLSRVYGDGLKGLLTDFKSFKAAAADVKEAGTALDMATNTRAKALFGLDEFQPFANKVDAVTGAMAQNFGVVSLMAPWNAGMKQFVGVITQNRMLKSIRKMAEGGAIDPKETEYLAANFINKGMAKRIANQFAKHGEETDGVLVPNARAWDDMQAQETFRAAVRRDVDRTIVTPGQDKPLWMSRSGWKLLGQFRSFAMASTQRTMLAGLQQRDLAVLNGALLSVAMGSLTYMAKSAAAGYEIDTSPDRLIREGIDRSGLLAWLVDANQVVEKVSRGRLGANAIFGGPPLSRYASRSALEAVFGPTYGMIGNLTQVAGNALAGDWQAADTRTMRRMMPYNNLFYIRQLFDEAEANINEFFGVKGK